MNIVVNFFNNNYLALFFFLFFLLIFLPISIIVPFFLDRKGRVRIFKNIASEFGLDHDFQSVRLFNKYGQFNFLKGIISGHAVEISDIDERPSMLSGVTSSLPRLNALKYSPQRTVIKVDGVQVNLSEENKEVNMKNIFVHSLGSYGYVSEETIRKYLKTLSM